MNAISHFNASAPMLQAYPDSIGEGLHEAVQLLHAQELRGLFDTFYILPSVFNSDVDRGFSIINYDLNAMTASEQDLKALKDSGIALKLDFVLNHLSVLSPQFQDVLRNGSSSRYKNFFINWNTFWESYGERSPDGIIIPREECLRPMFFRKPGLPILKACLPDGQEIPYWNTFYHKVYCDAIDPLQLMDELGTQYSQAQAISDAIRAAQDGEGGLEQLVLGKLEYMRPAILAYLKRHRRYLGQLDLNLTDPLVWEFYEDTLCRLAGYGADIVRLDALGYAAKRPGARNFMTEPDTWLLLRRLKKEADALGLTLLPEIHASYGERTHERVCEEGCITYDFFFPGLLLDALENQSFAYLMQWIQDIQNKGLQVVNMLGCHDGIPLLDLEGLLPDSRIQTLVEILRSRGGLTTDFHGAKNVTYYQVCSTYFSALGGTERRLLFARALQMFMPGKPQVWYLDLFAGTNDVEAVRRAGPSGLRDINRTNLSIEDATARLQSSVVQKQLRLLRFRTSCPAFGPGSQFEARWPSEHTLVLIWQAGDFRIQLEADAADCSFRIVQTEPNGVQRVVMAQ